jgi:hypothetical protein
MKNRCARYFLLPALVFATLPVAALAQSAPGSVLVDRNVTLQCSADAPNAIHEAAKDLANDLEKVLGARPRSITEKDPAGAVNILIGVDATLPDAVRPAQIGAPESFSIRAVTTPGGKEIVLSGADMRGTLYAIYQFSEDFLGVDPLYYWTDKVPAHQDSIAVPATLDHEFPAPVWKYRGFFLNDEDLLTGWAPGEKDKAGISLDVWNKVYETILRLKGNMVVPGSWIFPDDPQVGLAGKRGLIVNQHHATPVGVNVARWPQEECGQYL